MAVKKLGGTLGLCEGRGILWRIGAPRGVVRGGGGSCGRSERGPEALSQARGARAETWHDFVLVDEEGGGGNMVQSRIGGRGRRTKL